MSQSVTEITKEKHKDRDLWFKLSMILFGAVGWFASFMLATEYIKTLKNPDYIPGCSVSVIISCSPNMASWQGSVLGFSNTFIGISMFMIPIVLGVILLTGYKMKKWFWNTYKIGMGAAFIFILWFSYQSIFSLNTLCPWCMVIWVAVIFLFWGSVFRKPYLDPENEEDKNNELHNWRFTIITLVIITIATVAQLKLDWLADVFRML